MRCLKDYINTFFSSIQHFFILASTTYYNKVLHELINTKIVELLKKNVKELLVITMCSIFHLCNLIVMVIKKLMNVLQHIWS